MARIDGISAGAAQTGPTDLRADLEALPTERHFVSCPGLARQAASLLTSSRRNAPCLPGDPGNRERRPLATRRVTTADQGWQSTWEFAARLRTGFVRCRLLVRNRHSPQPVWRTCGHPSVTSPTP